MALTIVVRAMRTREAADEGQPAPSAASKREPELSITLDAPRVIIGRGEGCEVRLPDPSVSLRHASIRQRGGEHLLVDEKSTNGTFIGRVKLPPEAPRVLRSGELIRVGRVWLEVRIEAKLVSGKAAAAAKELALDLVSRGLAAQGEDPHPILRVIDGPDKGKELRLADPGRRYILGRGKESDLCVDDPDASRRHVDVARKGDALAAHDLGSKGGTKIDGGAIGQTDVAWKPGQELSFGGNTLTFEYPAAEALAEIERSPDEIIPAAEALDLAEPDEPEPEPVAEKEPPADLTPSPAPSDSPIRGARSKGAAAPREGTWGLTDAAIVLLALGVLVLSAAGLWLLFAR